MSDADSLYENAGAFTTFEKLKLGQSTFFNRTIWPNGEITWLGLWETQGRTHAIANFVKMRRVTTAFIVRVTKHR